MNEGNKNPNWKGGISLNGKEYRKQYFQKNKERNTIKSREWFRNNKKRGKEILSKARNKVRLETLSYYGGNPPKCACCGESELKFLSIDHINNNGNVERRLLNKSGGGSFYFNLRKRGFPKGYQVLCHNCNMAKAFYGSCPHGN
jgi:hypothetical protein